MKDMSEKIRDVVEEYFDIEEKEDLMDYGESGNPGLNDISEPVAECLTELGYPVEYNYAEEGLSDGKYVIHIGCLGKDNVYDLYAWHGENEVIDIIEEILK
jgi:hypothetical protein